MIETIPQNFEPIYFCPLCADTYPTVEEALACYENNESYDPAYKPGTIIMIDHGYTWYEQEAWVIDNKGEALHGGPAYRFWGIITANQAPRANHPHVVERDAHRAIYHIGTAATSRDFIIRWTHFNTHFKPDLPPIGMIPPKEVLDAAQTHLYQASPHLW